MEPVRVLRYDDGPSVLDPGDFLKDAEKSSAVDALALPLGDALQEPNWTQGLGINRGFHTARNQAFACLVARESGLVTAGASESRAAHECVLGMKWGAGTSGLAGSGS